MRTTLNIDSVVLEDLKRIQAEGEWSLGQLASELLAEAIALRKAKPSSAPPPFSWHSRNMGARVDLEDKEAIYVALEGDSE